MYFDVIIMFLTSIYESLYWNEIKYDQFYFENQLKLCNKFVNFIFMKHNAH